MSWVITSPTGIVLGDFPHTTGRFYDSRLQTAYTTFALVTNTLYAVPFYVPATNTYTSIAIEVTTLAGGASIRLGIYNDLSGVPGSLITDAGTVSAATTGGKTIVISQSLAAGWYWLAAVANGTPTVRALSQTNALPSLGFTSNTDVTIHVGWSVAFTYAALPNPFTGGGALLTTAAPRLLLGF